jgi:chromosome segregation ATPase
MNCNTLISDLTKLTIELNALNSKNSRLSRTAELRTKESQMVLVSMKSANEEYRKLDSELQALIANAETRKAAMEEEYREAMKLHDSLKEVVAAETQLRDVRERSLKVLDSEIVIMKSAIEKLSTFANTSV